MKLIAKTKAILYQTNAETMVEVVVAFVVLSIVMALFAQGLRYATSAENYAIENGKAYDKALTNLQKTITENFDDIDSGVYVSNDVPENKDLDSSVNALKLTEYTVSFTEGGDVNTFHYWVFDANLG